jgi:hypothetical protein
MKKDSLLVPIRRRGAIRAKEGDVFEEAGKDRAKDSVFFTEELAHHVPTMVSTLEDLVGWLREKSHLHLSMVLYGWASPQTRAFLAALRPHLTDVDALWLVPGEVGAESVAEPEIERAVVLKRGSRDSHRRTLANLIGDAVFFAAQGPEEASEVQAWKGRARAVVVHQAEAADSILKAAALHRMPCYVWDGKTLEEI